MNAVRIVAADGRALEASSLRAEPVDADAPTRAHIRRLARTSGLIVETETAARYGVGVAARLTLRKGLADPTAARDIVARLAAIPAEADAAPVAFASLAFRADEPAQLVVPSVTLSRRGGEESVVLVAQRRGFDLGRYLDACESALSNVPRPGSFEVTYPEPRDDYLRRVQRAIDAIGRGAFEKVVLARNCIVTANAPYRQGDLVAEIRAAQPKTTVFALDGFFGASPELLIERSGASVASTPLAGTVPHLANARDNAATIATLFSSEKERFEHRVVVEEIEKVLTACGASLEAGRPEPLELATVTHLATRITGTLGEDEASPRPSSLELALALHPTPAIGGSPRPAALSYLARTEPFDRGRYGGPVGYVDANGDGAWWIGIRSATVRGAEAVLCAGGGIVAGSEPEAEFAETEAKLAAMLAVLTAS